MSDFLYYNSSVRKMESAALILGIISVVTCLILYISIPCGALAIMFAFLSRGGNYKMSEKAIAGLWVGIAGIILTFITLVMIQAALTSTKPSKVSKPSSVDYS